MNYNTIFFFFCISSPCMASLERPPCTEVITPSRPAQSGMETELRLLDKHTEAPHSNQSEILSALDLEVDLNVLKSSTPTIPFIELSTASKQKKLQELTAARSASFYRTRNFPGLKLRNPMPLKWNQTTQFLGKTYEPFVTHMVDISPLLYLPKVEYGEPSETKRVGLLEVHFSSTTLSPRQLRDEAWTMLEGAGIQKSQAHLHIIGTPSPHTPWLSKAEFWRRQNLAAEAISIVDKGFTLKDISQNGHISMGILDRSSLADGAQSLRQIDRGEEILDEDKFKAFFVGMHLPGKYKDSQAMGFQFRTLDKTRAAQFDPLIETSTQFLSGKDVGLTSERMTKWLAYMKAKAIIPRSDEAYLGMTHYNAPVRQLLRDGSMGMKEFFKEKENLLKKIDQESQTNRGLLMLLHDYSNDPLFFDEVIFLQKVNEEQIKALKDYQGGANPKTILRNFLLNSGLYQRYRSLETSTQNQSNP